MKNGLYETYYMKSGNIKTRENYKNDKLHGEYIKYYQNGNINIKTCYKEGRVDNIYLKYYANGKIKYKGELKNGKLSKSIFYDQDGTIKEEKKI